jgi:hypothetical protein
MIRKLLVLLVLVFAVAAVAQAEKADEVNRPKNFGSDFQVPPRAGAPEAILLTESFDAGIPATWTVLDAEGTGMVWTITGVGGPPPPTEAPAAYPDDCGEANYTGGTGLAACASSDLFGAAEFDTTLVSPTFDFCNATGVALQFRANYQNFASLDFFAVDGSSDGGATWTNLLTWNEDHGPFRAAPGEAVNLALGAPFDNQPSVQFRFRYWDPNTEDYAWYAQIDDFVLDGAGSVASPGVATCEQEPGPSVLEIPTLAPVGLVGLGLLLAGGAIALLRRRRA